MRKTGKQTIKKAKEEFARIMKEYGCNEIAPDYFSFKGRFGLKYIILLVNDYKKGKFSIKSGSMSPEKNCIKYDDYNFNDIKIEEFQKSIDEIIIRPIVYYDENGHRSSSPFKSRIELGKILDSKYPQEFIKEFPLI